MNPESQEYKCISPPRGHSLTDMRTKGADPPFRYYWKIEDPAVRVTEKFSVFAG